jgi:hypothetical protein
MAQSMQEIVRTEAGTEPSDRRDGSISRSLISLAHTRPLTAVTSRCAGCAGARTVSPVEGRSSINYAGDAVAPASVAL